MGLTVNRRRVQHNVKRHRKNKKPLILGALVFFIFIAGFCFFYLKEPKTPPISTSTKTTTIPANVDNTITFIVSGDELPHTSVDQNALTASGSYNYLPFFSLVQPYMTSADMSFCNQESPSDPNDAVSGYPTFNAPSIFPQDLQRIGCNIINLANNHADDKGQAGIDATLDVWDSLKPLAVAGTARSPAEQNQVALFTVKGVRFAFLAYTQCSNGQNVSSYGLNNTQILSLPLCIPAMKIIRQKTHGKMLPPAILQAKVLILLLALAHIGYNQSSVYRKRVAVRQLYGTHWVICLALSWILTVSLEVLAS